MKRFAIALLVGALTSSALAAGSTYYVEMDTVGNCSVVDSKPAKTSGMTILGNKTGYSSADDAKKALKALPKDKCKGIVE